MTYQAHAISDDQSTLANLPSWVTVHSGETTKNVAFLSGALFAMLDMSLQQSGESIPKILLKNTLAMKAAVSTSKLEGRMSREADIRDAYHLTPPNDDGTYHWGPDGNVLDFWRRAGRLRLNAKDWDQRVATVADDYEAVKDRVEDAMATSLRFGPMAGAVQIMEDVLRENSRAERLACLLSDIVMAKSFGWDFPLSLTALHLTKANLRNLVEGTDEAALMIQSSIMKSAQMTFHLAKQLTTRAEALRSIAPKLRSRGSDDAVALFLTEDVVAPSGMLSPLIRGTRTQMTGRAARRLCDRLVEFGVVKELTGRSTFRLYGVTP